MNNVYRLFWSKKQGIWVQDFESLEVARKKRQQVLTEEKTEWTTDPVIFEVEKMEYPVTTFLKRELKNEAI